MRPLRIIVLIGLVSGVAGCVLPPALSIASFVADGVSIVGSGKTVTDHAISLLAHKDCRMWRLLKGESICQAETTVVATAKLPPPLPMHAASPALRPPDPNPVVAGFVVDGPDAGIAVPLPAPKASTPDSAPALAASAAQRAGPPAPSSLPPSPPPTAVANFVLDEPDTAIPVSLMPPPKAAAAPKGAAAREPGKAPARLKRVTQQASAPMQAAPTTAEVPVRTGAVHGEMIIRSGTDETEARALADSLNAVGAFVRPVHHGDITIYEVVMHLSG